MEIREVRLNAENAVTELEDLISRHEFVVLVLPNLGRLMVHSVPPDFMDLFADSQGHKAELEQLADIARKTIEGNPDGDDVVYG